MRCSGILALLAALALASCTVGSPLFGETTMATKTKGEEMLSYAEKAESLYARGLVKMEKDNCTDAIKIFEKIRTTYPFTSEATLAELRIADCEFQQQNYAQAGVRYKEFASNHSAHPDVDYATFRNALSVYKRIPKEWFILPPVHERDQAATKEALAKFRAFINSFPLSDHVEEAKEYAEDCMRQLAEHELYVARFYLKKKKYEGTLARCQNVIDKYPGSGLVPEAILIKAETYLKSGKKDQARATFLRIIEDYPQSFQAKQAKKYLKALK
jgi:outer membrane protein assembly factor BamD